MRFRSVYHMGSLRTLCHKKDMVWDNRVLVELEYDENHIRLAPSGSLTNGGINVPEQHTPHSLPDLSAPQGIGLEYTAEQTDRSSFPCQRFSPSLPTIQGSGLGAQAFLAKQGRVLSQTTMQSNNGNIEGEDADE